MVRKLPMRAISSARNGTKRAVIRQETASPVRTTNRRTPPDTPEGLQTTGLGTSLYAAKHKASTVHDFVAQGSWEAAEACRTVHHTWCELG